MAGPDSVGDDRFFPRRALRLPVLSQGPRWVDDGTTHVLAIRMANETFKSSLMDNPKAKLEGNYVTAVALAGTALIFAWAIWWVIPHKRPGSPQ